MSRVRPLRILIPGGTGRIGLLLARYLHDRGHVVSTITRFPKPREWEPIHWDAQTLGPWVSAFEDADAVINLAGRSMRCRYSAANRRSILQSRVRTTELVGEAINNCARPPLVWLNASMADIYAPTQRDAVSELDVPAGQGFPAELAHAWEAAMMAAHTPNTRQVRLRMAAVMSPKRGPFPALLRLVRAGFGGEIADGEQYVAWMHDVDFVRAVEFLILDETCEGAINLTSPEPLPNHELMHTLRNAWSSNYFGLPLPRWMVQVVAFTLQREAELVLKSRRVVPYRLLEAGFEFQFPTWSGACADLLQRSRREAYP